MVKSLALFNKAKSSPESPAKLEIIADYLISRGSPVIAEIVREGKSSISLSDWEKHIKRHGESEERIKEIIEKLRHAELQDTPLFNSVTPSLPTLNEGTTQNNQNAFSLLKAEIRKTIGLDNLKILPSKINENWKNIHNIISRKWDLINSTKRVFGFSKSREYAVKVTVPLLIQLGIEEIRFIQGEFKPPSIGINFIMSNNITFHCHLNEIGLLESDDKLDSFYPSEYRLLINLAVVLYYTDLTISENSKFISKKSSESQPKPYNTTQHEPSTETRIKLITRKTISSKNQGSNKKRFGEKSSSMVDPFRRRLPQGQSPNFLKIAEADQFGINLHGPGYPDIKYTFVNAHSRGGHEDILYEYRLNYEALKTFESILENLFSP